MSNARRIGIIGTGMIATSLAVLCTGHGCPVTVLARSPESESRCRSGIDAAYRDLLEHGLLTEAQRDICLSYLYFTGTYADLAGAELVFECIVEDLAEKQKVYRILEEVCPSLRAICSVSSSLVPAVLSEGLGRYGDRIVVTHPFNPAHMVPYMEVCACDRTAEDVVPYVMQILTELDRKPVLLKKPTPGFIGNRLQFALLREAIKLVESGIADPADVDTCLQYSFCPRYTSIGIFEHFDHGGMNLCSTVCGNLFPILSDEKKVPAYLTNLMAEGKMGADSGEGFYDWRGTDPKAYDERVSGPYWKFCHWEYPETAEKDIP